MRQPDWAVLCSVPSSVRLASPQQCSPARNGRFARPCDTPLAPASRFGLRPQGICSTYTYMSSGRSPARLVSFSQVPPRSALRNCGFVPKPCFCGLSARPSASPLKTLRVFRRLSGGEASRAWHLWSSSARCSRSRPHSRSMRRRSRRLRGDTRRNASSAEYRLLALRRVSLRIRRTASLHVAQFGTRPLVPSSPFAAARFSS